MLRASASTGVLVLPLQLPSRRRRFRQYTFKRCQASPCCPPQHLDRRTAELYLQQLDGWQLHEDSRGRLHLPRTWLVKSFSKGMALCNKVAAVAEREGHHPDIHLTGTDAAVACRQPGWERRGAALQTAMHTPSR